MSHTVTISDALYSRLEAAARSRGLGNVQQLLENLPTADDDASRFQTLAAQWKKETAYISNLAKRAIHPAFQEIIGMGKAVVPQLLAELKREPDDWFWAQHAITGANPIPEQSRGRFQDMADTWVRRGATQGFNP